MGKLSSGLGINQPSHEVTNKRSTNIIRLIYIGFFIASIFLTHIVGANQVDYDTARVRNPKPVKKQFGEVLADVPGELLKLPFRTLEFITYIVSTKSPTSKLPELFRFEQEVHPYNPIVGYADRPGLKLGYGVRRESLFWDDVIKFKWYYSTHDYQSYQIQYYTGYSFQRPLGVNLYFRYKKRPREKLFGVGNGSLQAKEANFTLENTEVRVDVPWRPVQRTGLVLSAGYQVTNLYDGKDPNHEGSLSAIAADADYALQLGHLDATRFVTLGVSWDYDSRDSRSRPSRGSLISAEYKRFIGIDRSEVLDFNKYNLDLQQHLNIWRYRTLVVRVNLQRLDADSENNLAIPIYMLSQLGGLNTLRGYTSARFIDNDFSYASLEYRYPVHDFIDAFVFFEEGRVYQDMDDEAFFNNWKYSTGFGLRYWKQGSLLGVIQIGRSRETTKFYLELGSNL